MIVLYGIVTVTAVFGWLSLSRFRAGGNHPGSPRLQGDKQRDGTICRNLANDLASASSVAAAWNLLRDAARHLGFSYVELTLHPLTPAPDERFPRYTERLRPAPRSPQPPETTFAIAVVAPSARGQVVFSRSANLRHLDPEVPFLISAVADELPDIIERTVSGAEMRRRNSHRRERSEHSEGHQRRSATMCRSCGSARVFRSRVRSTFEQCRKIWTSKRLYECLSCGWRGWQEPHVVAPRAVRTMVPPPDLRGLDLAFHDSHTSDLPPR
jgi:hypothetical protein